MVYRIQLSPTAMADVGDAYTWIQGQSPEAAVLWFSAIQQEMRSLAEIPARCSVADESKTQGEKFG